MSDKIVGRPGARVQIVLLDRDIDLGPIVEAGLVFGHVGAADNARQDHRRDDPQDRDDGEQLHERERGSILVDGDSLQNPMHDVSRSAVRIDRWPTLQ